MFDIIPISRHITPFQNSESYDYYAGQIDLKDVSYTVPKQLRTDTAIMIFCYINLGTSRNRTYNIGTVRYRYGVLVR